MVDTCTITWTARDFGFAAIAGTQLVFIPKAELSLAGAAGVLYVPNREVAISDGSGAGSIALVPGNYVLHVITPSGTATATLAVPNLATATIGYCIDNVLLAPTIGDVQALVLEAETAATAAAVSAVDAAGSAASALAIYGSVDAQNAAVATAQAQASLSAGYAASAASVVQQDLSGVTAQALHRSPNAVTAMIIYDTSKDSDGGAWTEKCQHTSWWNEAINGKWLGAQPSELDARLVAPTLGAELVSNGDFSSGATTGWSASGSAALSVVSGRLRVANGAAVTGGATFVINTVAGRTYQWTYFIDPATSGGVAVRARDNTSLTVLQTATRSIAGTHTVTFVAQGSTTQIQGVNGFSTVGAYHEFDNVSVREVTAVTTQTGDYFQLSTDGKFYCLNAGNGTTEVFRGNKRDFPRLAGIVAEASNVTIYDLTERGVNGSFPMWMSFQGSYTFSVGRMLPVHLSPSTTISAIAAINGSFLVGSVPGSMSSTGLVWINFATDAASFHNAFVSDTGTFRGNIAQRNLGIGWSGSQPLPRVANSVINTIAMTVLPDAPVDPVTGLRVPTIAVGTSGGINIIRHDGVVTLPSAVQTFNVGFDSRGAAVFQMGENGRNYRKSLPPYTQLLSYTGGPFGLQTVGYLAGVSFNRHTGRQGLIRRVSTNAVSILRDNDKATSSYLGAVIEPTFNTGWMAGDIRRCFLSDTEVGSVTGPELVTNGTFDTDTTGWAVVSGDETLSVSSGRLRVTCGADGFAGSSSGAYQTLTGLTVGRVYQMRVAERLIGTNGAVGVRVFQSFGATQVTQLYGFANASNDAVLFVAPASTLYLQVYTGYGTAGTWVEVDGVSVREVVADRSYKNAGASINGTITRAQLASGTSLVGYSGFSAANYLREPYSADLDFGTAEWTGSAWVNIPTGNAAAGTILSRAFSSGAYITLGIDATNKLTATTFDGTTTRTVTTSAAYNTGQWIKARVNYTTDGTLAILVNGREVATTRGTPLLTLSNASAVLTIGNSYDLAAPFPGSIALLKLGATVPTPEQAIFMFEQEKQLFRAGALSVLPDSGAIVDMAYDDTTDRWVAISATNESYWAGLVRNSVQAVPAGSFSRVVAGSGLELAARTGTNSGVDVTIPAYGLREELVRRAEAAARLSRELTVFDFVGGFTANTTNGSTAITSVAGLAYPTSYIGARVSGAGIPANTTITAVSGTTIYLSAAATATATGVSISFLDFALPVGLEAKSVLSAGTLRQEGSTKDFTRLFDGFRETTRFAVAPGATAWVQIQAARAAQ